MSPTIIKPRQTPGSSPYTKMKLFHAKEEVEKVADNKKSHDPIQNWFFNPKGETYSHKIVDFASTRYQPTSVDIKNDPYYTTKKQKKTVEEKVIEEKIEKKTNQQEDSVSGAEIDKEINIEEIASKVKRGLKKEITKAKEKTKDSTVLDGLIKIEDLNEDLSPAAAENERIEFKRKSRLRRKIKAPRLKNLLSQSSDETEEEVKQPSLRDLLSSHQDEIKKHAGLKRLMSISQGSKRAPLGLKDLLATNTQSVGKTNVENNKNVRIIQ